MTYFDQTKPTELIADASPLGLYRQHLLKIQHKMIIAELWLTLVSRYLNRTQGTRNFLGYRTAGGMFTWWYFHFIHRLASSFN
jgi:hypothetical protein